MHSHQRLGKRLVEFYEDFLGTRSESGDVPDAASEQHLAVLVDGGCLYDGEVDIAIEAVTHFLGHFREMSVEIVGVVGVDALAQVRGVLVRRAHVDGVVAREDTVDMVVGGGSGEYVHLEFPSLFMLAGSFCRQRFGDALRVAGGSETRQAEGVAVANHFGCFSRRDKFVSHDRLVSGFFRNFAQK